MMTTASVVTILLLKKSFFSIHEDIAKLISEEQVEAATNGTSMLNVVTESRARVLRLLK
jgi:hypothetical protein